MADERRIQENVRCEGLVVDDPVAWARREGAEVVDFSAPRGPKLTPKRWLDATAALSGRSARERDALVDAVLRRAGLSALGATPIAALAPPARAALAIAEVAVAVVGRKATVVVPEPPLPWPQRHDVRRLAVSLLAPARTLLHAREAWELAPLVDPEDLRDEAGRALGGAEGRRTILVRTYGHGEPYEAFRRALDESGVTIEGGPIAHVLSVPDGFGVRQVLAIAADAGIDVLEARDPLSFAAT